MNEEFNFLKKLSYDVNKLKGNKPFNLNIFFTDKQLLEKNKKSINKLIKKDFFFLQKAENNLYKKTYRIPEICNRTLLELKKENINSKILKMIEKYPIILHIEFERWINTKHKSMISYILDKYWYNFMLYSYEYNSWCYDKFGYLLHHIPTPDYENKDLMPEDIIIDHAEYFREYRKAYPISKTILLYNLPYKLREEEHSFKKIKNIIFDLISELSEYSQKTLKLDIEKLEIILKEINNSIMKNSYIVLKNKLTLDEYNYINKKLGSVINITNIKVNHQSDRKFNSYKPMPLHTDAYDVDLVSWFCQEQDIKDGRIILKNLRDYKDFFTKDEQKKLKKIKIKYPIYKKFYTGEYALLKKENFYYASWLEKDNYSKSQTNSLNKFKEFIYNQKEIKIKLDKGDVLIIDNTKIIHGRDLIEKDSKRLLYRTHISK